MIVQVLLASVVVKIFSQWLFFKRLLLLITVENIEWVGAESKCP
jgi:hypothetical protein